MLKFLTRENIKKAFLFFIWGVVTTAIYAVVYFILRHFDVSVTISASVAWFVSVTFSFFANKYWVFKSQTTGFKEYFISMMAFYGSRLLSGLMDVALMNLFVKVLDWNELVALIIKEIIVSTFNFLFCFLVVFRNKKRDRKDIEEV